jgi:hypothetical protein
MNYTTWLDYKLADTAYGIEMTIVFAILLIVLVVISLVTRSIREKIGNKINSILFSDGE